MKWLVALGLVFFAALPASNNFKLNSYGFGSGGTDDSSSANYRVNGLTGEVSGSAASGNYKVGAGENYTKQAHVPLVALTNDNNWYNKLRVVVDPQNNPSDATFALAISTDNFTTTQYVKSDFTVGSTLTTGDYLTYAAWGGASGAVIRGLRSSTVYSVKARAYHGAFTESAWGPVASATTSDPQLSFDIDVAATDTQTNPPYQIDFGNLSAGTVVDTAERVWISLGTNAESGAKVYLSGLNGALHSAASGHSIASLTGDLSSAAEGYGVQGASATQTADGPFALVSPYDGAGQNVGIDDTVFRELLTTPGPITGGRGSFILKAKSQAFTPAATDYTEILTVVAAGSF